MNNIVFFVSSLDSGGLENYLLRFLIEKHSCFNNVYVWCKSGKSGQLDDAYTALGNVELIKVKLGYFGFSSYKYLEHFVKVRNVNAVCDFSGNFAGRVVRSASKAGVKKRVSAYRSASDRFEADLFRRLYNRWVRWLVYKHSTD